MELEGQPRCHWLAAHDAPPPPNWRVRADIVIAELTAPTLSVPAEVQALGAKVVPTDVTPRADLSDGGTHTRCVGRIDIREQRRYLLVALPSTSRRSTDAVLTINAGRCSSPARLSYPR